MKQDDSVYRIYDNVEERFCRSGRCRFAQNGRSVWSTISGVKVAFMHMETPENKSIIRYELVAKEVIHV